jgi:hypothetical protein
MSHVATHKRRGWVRFTLHYVEMIVAMFVGMGVFALLEAGVFALVGWDYSHAGQPVPATTIMTANMAAGMIIWMRVRRHGWPATLEMSGVMFVPLVVLAPLVGADVISGGSLYDLTHVAMFPLMLAVMLRRRAEYAGAHS